MSIEVFKSDCLKHTAHRAAGEKLSGWEHCTVSNDCRAASVRVKQTCVKLSRVKVKGTYADLCETITCKG